MHLVFFLHLAFAHFPPPSDNDKKNVMKLRALWVALGVTFKFQAPDLWLDTLSLFP